MQVRRTPSRLLVFLTLGILGAWLPAEQVRVVQTQGDVHGLLLLKDENGKVIADGDQIYRAHGSTVFSRTIFTFRDGSVDDEETTFHQGSTLRLIRDHHIQKGPSFPKPIDLTIDVPKDEVSWTDLSKKDNQPNRKHMKLPADLANGMIPLVVENYPRKAAGVTVSYLAVDSKPRIVKLTIKPDGSDKVFVGPDPRQAERFDMHVEIGGVAGVVAPLVGKQPPDTKVWLLGNEVPLFVRLEGPLYPQGPVWTVLLTAPTWPAESPKSSE